jgi:excinuclease UvrABC helicase subunit UvrB
MTDKQSVEQKLIFLVGVEGAGKSTLEKKLVANINRPTIIVEPDKFGDAFNYIEVYNNLKNIENIGRVIYSDYESDLFEDLLTVRNSLIVFDDFRLISQDFERLPQSLKTLFGRRRQMDNIIIVSLHGFKDIPAKAYTHISELIIFKTRDSTETLKKHIGNERYNFIEDSRIEINRRSNKEKYAFKIIPM